jgi:hypothetical protein
LKTETSEDASADHVGNHYVGGCESRNFLFSHPIGGIASPLLVEACPASKTKTNHCDNPPPFPHRRKTVKINFLKSAMTPVEITKIALLFPSRALSLQEKIGEQFLPRINGIAGEIGHPCLAQNIFVNAKSAGECTGVLR